MTTRALRGLIRANRAIALLTISRGPFDAVVPAGGHLGFRRGEVEGGPLRAPDSGRNRVRRATRGGVLYGSRGVTQAYSAGNLPLFRPSEGGGRSADAQGECPLRS